jgi:DNA-binding GntR family transcriptional regulator
MELVRVDTQRAYEVILNKITTLELAPGTQLNEQNLAEELGLGETPVLEALKLLAHDNLVVVTPRHGLYVADVSLPDLEQISEMRLSLETLCARLAAQRATADDLAVLEALRQEQAATVAQGEAGEQADMTRFFDLDHKFHQAVAQAAHNRYLARTLDQSFGLSQRLWYMVLPHLGFLPAAVGKHLDLVEAIKAGDADRAGQIMHDHVQEFYARVREILASKEEEK